MPSIPQLLQQLTDRVEALEASLAEERELRRREKGRFEYRHSKIRAHLIRLEIGACGEMSHVGEDYKRGSRLQIPRRPEKFLMARHLPSHFKMDEHADSENMKYGRRGIPATV